MVLCWTIDCTNVNKALFLLDIIIIAVINMIIITSTSQIQNYLINWLQHIQNITAGYVIGMLHKIECYWIIFYLGRKTIEQIYGTEINDKNKW